MRISFLIILSLFFTLNTNAETVKDSLDIHLDSIGNWKETNKFSLILTQNSFLNWSAGGNNSISGIIKGHSTKDFRYMHLVWTNELKISYGLNKEAERELRKTEDKFELNSTFGYRKNTTSNWYYSAKFNFRTQITKGYKYPNTDKPISNIMAPGYLFLGVGSEYY